METILLVGAIFLVEAIPFRFLLVETIPFSGNHTF